MTAAQTQLYKFTTGEKSGITSFTTNLQRTSVTVYREVGDGLFAKIATQERVKVYGDDGATRVDEVFDSDPNSTYYFSVTANKGGEIECWTSVHEVDTTNNDFSGATELAVGWSGGYIDYQALNSVDPVDCYRFTIDKSGTYDILVDVSWFGNVKQTIYDGSYRQIDSSTQTKTSGYTEKYLAAGVYYLKFEATGARGAYANVSIGLA